jgi:hypothetical protein
MKLISLSKGKAYAIVDDEDFDYLNQWKWKFNKGRAMRNQHIGTVGNWRDGKRKDKAVLMHRVIMGEPEGMDVDHENRNALDNRKANLRICTHAENRRNNKIYSNNTIGYKGVYWDKRKLKYYTQISFMGKKYTLALFESAEEAAKEYDHVARQLYGEFATLNFEGDK